MNTAIDFTNRLENHESDFSTIIEDEFEEAQIETPWEIFNSELNNWNAISFYASDI